MNWNSARYLKFMKFGGFKVTFLRQIQAFLDFCGFDFRNFRFNEVYNSILFSSPLVLLSNLDLHGFWFPWFFICPHINSVNQGIPVHLFVFEIHKDMVNFLGSFDYFFMSSFRRFLLERCGLLLQKLLVFWLFVFASLFATKFFRYLLWSHMND